MTESVCEEKIFDSVFMSHSEYLRNFLYYKSGDLQRSEDLMQDAFCTLWEECAKVPIEKAKSFLFTVASNLFLNQEKHKKVVLKFERRKRNKTNKETPQFLLEKDEFEKRLQAGINALSEGQREVFLMSRIDGLKYREIAERLGVSIKAVEKRMHKALLSLREISKKV
ncbi:sigma-70 family RNA polymerase sigma factor [Saprospiraceae bacterium]|nr:sigma-70 family RNA polymerase sigma factor [Saprospiraceae bacterium]